jgi:DNA polymerase IV
MCRLTWDNWMAVMADRPTDALWGIGTKAAKKLGAGGITTIGQLAPADPAMISRWLPRCLTAARASP